jgi:lysophospholipase L1-like esterase
MASVENKNKPRVQGRIRPSGGATHDGVSGDGRQWGRPLVPVLGWGAVVVGVTWVATIGSGRLAVAGKPVGCPTVVVSHEWSGGAVSGPRDRLSGGAVRDDDDDGVGTEFRLKSTDHLTLIGGTLIERLQTDGQLEVALYQHFGALQPGGSSLQVRNLGWSGDDVWGTARAVFGQPSDGFARLKSDLALTQPSVAMIAYGANESFSGPAGLEKFQAGLRAVIEMTRQSGAQPLLVTPPPFEDLGPPLPSMTVANQNLSLYCDVIRRLAVELQLPLIDLHRQIHERPGLGTPRTENGIHLTVAGRAEVSRLLLEGLLGSKTSDGQWTSAGRAEELLAMVRQKNEWFFHRYRPQNETYLFLFRKHEQGNNAVEIPQFDALIQGLEQTIQRAATFTKSSE